MSDSAFHQTTLSYEELDYGLVTRTDRPLPPNFEPVPWEPIAGFMLEPEDLERALGLRFQETFDGLDYLRLAILELSSGRRVALYRYRGARGLLLSILPQQFTLVESEMETVAGAVTDAVVREVLDVLTLDPGVVEWRHPRLIKPRVTPPHWPAIPLTSPTADRSSVCFAEDDVRAYLAANPAIATLKATLLPRVEAIEFLSQDEAKARGLSLQRTCGPVCLVILHGAFVDSPPPRLGPPSSCPEVRLLFNARSGELDHVITMPAWGRESR